MYAAFYYLPRSSLPDREPALLWRDATLRFDCFFNRELIAESLRGIAMAVLTLSEKFDQLGTRYDELTQQLSTQELVSDSSRFQKVAKQHAELQQIVAKHREYKQIEKDLGGSQGNGRARAQAFASPERSQRRKERHRGNPRRHRGRRSGHLRRRSLPHVFALRRNARLESRGPGKLALVSRRSEGNRRRHSGQQSLFQAEVRKRRAPRPACSRHRAAGAHSHLRCHRRRASGGR